MIIVTFALGTFTLCGFAGLALDVTYLQMWKRKAQTAADAAAQAAAIELKRTQTGQGATSAGVADAAANGFDATNSTVTVENPPASGTHQGDNRYVLARVSRSMPTYFKRVFGREAVTVGATAHSGLAEMESCVFVMNSSVNNSMQVAGTTDVTMTCGVQVNSNSNSSLQV